MNSHGLKIVGRGGPADQTGSIAMIHAAPDGKIILMDIGDSCGTGHNELLARGGLEGHEARLLGV